MGQDVCLGDKGLDRLDPHRAKQVVRQGRHGVDGHAGITRRKLSGDRLQGTVIEGQVPDPDPPGLRVPTGPADGPQPSPVRAESDGQGRPVGDTYAETEEEPGRKVGGIRLKGKAGGAIHIRPFPQLEGRLNFLGGRPGQDDGPALGDDVRFGQGSGLHGTGPYELGQPEVQ